LLCKSPVRGKFIGLGLTPLLQASLSLLSAGTPSGAKILLVVTQRC
jgi:hypothetical protein